VSSQQENLLVVLCSMLLAPCAAVEAQQTGKISRIGFLDAGTAAGIGYSSRRSGRSCASLAGLKEKTSPSSIGLPNKTLSVYLSLRRTWFVLTSISLWSQGRERRWQPS